MQIDHHVGVPVDDLPAAAFQTEHHGDSQDLRLNLGMACVEHVSALDGDCVGDLAAGGIRVNALVTGNVDTPLYRRLVGVAPDADVDLPAPNPTGRVASVDEIAAYVAFLLSDESRFITGAALAIDGGATAS